METLDRKIRPLYERGLGCRVIGQTLDEDPVTILKRTRIMGITRTRDEAHFNSVPDGDIPFSREPCSTELRRSAIGIAIRWFLDRGYLPSIPVETAPYDLVVESDRGFQRVQVKTTTIKSQRTPHWITRISHSPYDSEAGGNNASGKRKEQAYTRDEVDQFFIVTQDRGCYLIPLEATGNRKSLTLDNRFDKYKQQ